VKANPRNVFNDNQEPQEGGYKAQAAAKRASE
jgi:hypothetical protein